MDYKYERLGNVFSFGFPSHYLSLRIDRLREDSRFNVSGEIQVTSSAPGIGGHLHHARINLSSTQAKATLMRALNSRIPEDPSGPDWGAIIEATCLRVLEEYRRGEPAIHMGDYKPSERLPYRVDPFIREKEANVLWGAGGTGKTELALYLSALCSIPVLDGPFVAEPATVLYLDFEASADEIYDRLAGIYRGLDCAETIGSNIHYRYCAQPISADVEEIQRLIASLGVDLLIVDSLGLACGGEPEAGDAILGYFLALRALRTTSLTIHHQNKEGKLYGNVYIFNMTRNLWEIRSAPSKDSLNIGLFNRKTNNASLHAPVGLSVNFSEDMTTIKPQNVIDVPDLAEALPLYRQMVALLQAGAMSTSEIADGLGKSGKEAVIRATLNQYKKLFVRTGDNRWGLLST